MDIQRRTAKKRARGLVLGDILTFSGSIRIPVSESIPFADEVRDILATPEFQRLRGVRQLGPTHLVYPGAIHTRFEHSLGTYSLSLRYVDALLCQKEFSKFSQSPIEISRLLIASALLHDIGHYPFSHLMEEIGGLPNHHIKRHEERAQELIMGSELRSILADKWHLDPMDVCRAIRGVELEGGFALASSALNGVLDLDKMDYLMRDSVHCGVNFGSALDAGRFFTGLRIDTENACICLSKKAESYVPTLITVRNLMYNEVYWHKTVRAAGAMIKTLIYRLSELGLLRPKALTQLLQSQDDQVAVSLNNLTQDRRAKSLRPLSAPFVFLGRGLYKMVYDFGLCTAQGKPNAKQFLRSIFEQREVPLAQCLRRAACIESALRQKGHDILEGDILLEATPVKSGHETFDLENLRLFDERTCNFVKPSYDLGAADDLLDNSRHAFLYCHPARANLCRSLTREDWENVFHVAELQVHTSGN
jgi:HD superfamily phosphohydrolase